MDYIISGGFFCSDFYYYCCYNISKYLILVNTEIGLNKRIVYYKRFWDCMRQECICILGEIRSRDFNSDMIFG